MKLTTSEKIKILCNRQGKSISDLARTLGMSRQNLSNKLSRDNFPEAELIEIARALNCSYESYFILENGEKF
ncbi:MAG: transcriptional regulator [Alkaliphilus sp.]|nr:MAG: transcriptional regulator [Alkaliphilus sp.]